LGELMPKPTISARQPGGSIHDLFSRDADQFFRASLVQCSARVDLHEPSFAVLVVTRGSGELHCDGYTRSITRGETWVVPFGAGAVSFTGSLETIICLPPLA
jgi:mannose-6-phosphate isomerase class I